MSMHAHVSNTPPCCHVYACPCVRHPTLLSCMPVRPTLHPAAMQVYEDLKPAEDAIARARIAETSLIYNMPVYESTASVLGSMGAIYESGSRLYEDGGYDVVPLATAWCKHTRACQSQITVLFSTTLPDPH